MVTINDVAKQAGVSRGTVSNVINHGKVRPEYKKKVEDAIEELGYVPNAYARSLKSKKTYTVALLLPTVWSPFFSELTDAIEQELRRRGYRMFLCNTHNDYSLEKEYMRIAKENKVDGILSVTYHDLDSDAADTRIPMVAIGRYFSARVPFVSADNFQGGMMAAEKLCQLGCKRLAFIGRLSDKESVAGPRRDGFVSFCQESGVEFAELYSMSDAVTFIREVREFVTDNYRDRISYDGVFASTDQYVRYLMDAMEQFGCTAKPGGDVQMIGFDGAKSHAHDMVWISSMRQPVEEIASYAVETLCRQIAGEKTARYKLFPVTFVQGRTTKIKIS